MSGSCVFCGHKHLDKKTTRYIYQKKKDLLIVEGVPCLDCQKETVKTTIEKRILFDIERERCASASFRRRCL